MLDRPLLIDEISHQSAIAAVITRHPWQFWSLFNAGITIGTGWLVELEAACQDIETILANERDRALFSFVQVKEKLGELRLYCNYGMDLPLDGTEAENAALLEVLPLLIAPGYLQIQSNQPRLGLPDTTRQLLLARIETATKRCRIICETCGQRGILIKDGGWLRVRCELHEKGS